MGSLRSAPVADAIARCSMRAAWPVAAAVLAGCAYPRVVDYYDEECQIVARRMVVETTQASVLDACSNEACLLNIAVGAAFAVTSAVVSGSIVRVGNVLYWKERNRRCRRGEPYASAESPSPSPSPTPTPTTSASPSQAAPGQIKEDTR